MTGELATTFRTLATCGFISHMVSKPRFVARQASAWPKNTGNTTRDNLESTWVAFEAGAVACNHGTERVCPLLFQVPVTEVRGPLSQFQAIVFDREGTFRLLKSINAMAREAQLGESALTVAFEKWWPDLEAEVKRALDSAKEKPAPRRTDRDLIEETLALTRGLVRDSENRHLLVNDYAPLETTIAPEASEWMKAYARLHSWSCALLNSVRLNFSEVEACMSSKTALPRGCPSRASLIELILRQVDGKVREVEGAREDILKEIARVDAAGPKGTG